MYTPTNNADNVSRWPSLGVTLPKQLTEAIQLFEIVRYVEVGRKPVFDIDTVTPKNAEDKIREYAEQLSLSGAGSGLSVLEKAKRDVVDSAARRVAGLGRAAVPEVIEQLTPKFHQQVEAYTDAVARLPEDMTPETLLSAGPEAVEAYQIAQQKARYLNNISSWVAQTGILSGAVPKNMEVTLRILRPESLIELHKIDAAHEMPAKPTLQALDPVFYTAVRLSVPFGINTLREAAEIRKNLQLRPQALAGVATMSDFS